MPHGTLTRWPVSSISPVAVYVRKSFDAFHAGGGIGVFWLSGKFLECRAAPPAMVTHDSSMSKCGKLQWRLICDGLKSHGWIID
jgi:hypothetical protein